MKAVRAYIPGLLLLLLGATGIGVKIYGAWLCRYSTDPNFAINALMARHILEGQAFPVFYYGQEYMGTAECYSAALLSRLFGSSGFMVCLGTAVMSMLLLPLVYQWGKDAGGKAAGVSALAYLVIGPALFFHYSSCNLGYAVITLVSAAVVWLGGRIAAGFRASGRVNLPEVFALGVAAGIGWWSSQVIVFSILAAGVVLVLYLRLSILKPRLLLAGVSGFLLGALPWIGWNLTNDMGSLKVASSFRPEGWPRGLRMLFDQALPSLFGLRHLSTPLAALLIATILTAWIVLTILAVAAMTRKRSAMSAGAPYLAAIPALFLFTAAIYSMTCFGQKGSARYILPLVPATGVALGVVTAHCCRKWRYLGTLPLVVLILLQLPALGPARQQARADIANRAWAMEVRNNLREQQIDAAYISYDSRWLNFALDEEFCFWPRNGLRIESYWRSIERSENPAMLTGSGAVTNLLRSMGGSAKTGLIGGHVFSYDFQPPTESHVYLPASATASVTDAQGQEMGELLFDRMEQTCWPASSNLMIELKEPVAVTGVRLTSHNGRFPSKWQIFARKSGSPEWQPLTEPLSITPLNWWGPRPYWGGIYEKAECRFAPTEVEALSISFSGKEEPEKAMLSEVYLFTSSEHEGAPTDAAALATLREMLSTHHVTRLYCDRSAAASLNWGEELGIAVESEAYLPDSHAPPPDPVLRLENGTAVLTRLEDAGIVREAFHLARVTVEIRTVGPWVLFTLPADAPFRALSKNRSLRWNGFACMTTGPRELSLGLTMLAGDLPATSAIGYLLRALELLPQNRPAAELLSRMLADAGRQKESDEWTRRGQTMWTPRFKAETLYENGVRLLGATTDRETAKPEDTVAITYFWEHPITPMDSSIAVFSRVESDHFKFNDDRVFELEGTEYQPYPWVFTECRPLTIPPGTPSGTYTIRLGLYDRVTGCRLDASAEPASSQLAGCIPIVLRVVAE